MQANESGMQKDNENDDVQIMKGGNGQEKLILNLLLFSKLIMLLAGCCW